MIVVDKNTEVLDWVNALESDHLSCIRLDLITFEIATGLQTELILVHADILESATKLQFQKFSDCTAVVVFTDLKNDKSFELENLAGIISKGDNKIDATNILINIEAKIKTENILKSQLMSINNELNEILGGVEDQLFKVKHTYERMVPKRLEQFKGIKIFSKYAAGEKSGGEFFDLFASENKVFLLMSHTSSYIASSVILQHFSAIKNAPKLSNQGQDLFFKTVKDEVAKLALAQGKDISIKLLTLILDTTTMEVELKSLGDFSFFSSKGQEIKTNASTEVISQTFSLTRGERLMVCSPGFEQNWSEINSDIQIEELITNSEIKALDVLDELFFQLKKKSGSEFLKSDAASIVMEVEQNVMVQM